MNEKKFLESYDIRDYDTPLSTVDMAIFAVVDGDLSVLLVERDSHPYSGQLALPGGFIDLQRDADIDAAAFRKLQEKTGVKSPYLEQVETFGNYLRPLTQHYPLSLWPMNSLLLNYRMYLALF